MLSKALELWAFRVATLCKSIQAKAWARGSFETRVFPGFLGVFFGFFLGLLKEVFRVFLMFFFFFIGFSVFPKVSGVFG